VVVGNVEAEREAVARTLLRSIVLCATSKMSSSRSRARLPAVAGREGSAFFGLLFALLICKLLPARGRRDARGALGCRRLQRWGRVMVWWTHARSMI
jgi:hypothetical protein